MPNVSPSGSHRQWGRAAAMCVCFVAAVVCMALPTLGVARADWIPDCSSPTQIYADGATAPANFNVTAGDVILFTGGTYTGNINGNSVNGNLATICVDSGAQFNPSSINGAIELFVRGTALMPPLAAGAGALLDNEGTVTFQPVPNTNGPATVINRAGATILVQGSFSLGSGAVVTNDGTITVQGGVNQNGSSVTNNGSLTIGGAYNLSGTTNNTRSMTVTGQLTVNGNGTLTNSCSLTAVGLINNDTVVNNGVVDLGTSQLLNNSGHVYSQGPDALTTGGAFTNPGTISGSGQYLFNGITSTTGSIIGSPDPIVFFDTTQTGAQIFDVQSGTITNVIRQTVTPPAAGACTATPPSTTSTSTTSTSTSMVLRRFIPISSPDVSVACAVTSACPGFASTTSATSMRRSSSAPAFRSGP